jgi:hypothetical protein
MFSIVHATVGAIIGEQTQSPVWTALLAFGSHFVFDIIPHGDQNLLDDQPTPRKKLMKFAKIAAVDFLFTGFLFAWLLFHNAFHHLGIALLGAAAAILPDVISTAGYVVHWKWLEKYRAWHYQLHFFWNGFTISIGPGLVVQTITLTLLLGFLLR